MKHGKLIPLFLSLALLATLSILSGCGEDDKDNPVVSHVGPIEGSWDLVKVCSQDGSFNFCVPDSEIVNDPLYYGFKADSTGLMRYQGSETDFAWTRSGSTLTMTAGELSLAYTCNVTTTKMTLTFPSESYIVTHTFDRQ